MIFNLSFFFNETNILKAPLVQYPQRHQWCCQEDPCCSVWKNRELCPKESQSCWWQRSFFLMPFFIRNKTNNPFQNFFKCTLQLDWVWHVWRKYTRTQMTTLKKRKINSNMKNITNRNNDIWTCGRNWQRLSTWILYLATLSYKKILSLTFALK